MSLLVSLDHTEETATSQLQEHIRFFDAIMGSCASLLDTIAVFFLHCHTLTQATCSCVLLYIGVTVQNVANEL